MAQVQWVNMLTGETIFGGIGSGFTPPKYGFRSAWISVIRIRP